MSGRSDERQRAPSTRRLVGVSVLVLALAATAVAVAVGLDPGRESTGSPGGSAASASPSDGASLDLSALPILRSPFCDLLDEDDVEDALAAPVTDTVHYDSGDRVTLSPGLTDVAHEFSCSFRAADGTDARAWVFAEPVRAAEAEALVRETSGSPRCSPVAGAPTFGTPSTADRCSSSDPLSSGVTLRGLFGDAWLSCSLTSPGAPVAGSTARAEQWCVRVATTLGSRP